MYIIVKIFLLAAIIFTSCIYAQEDEDFTPIKYPGRIQEVSETRYETPDNIPEECRDKTFCTIKPPDYPQETFNKMFEGTKPLPRPTLVIENVVDRHGDPDEFDNCESSISYEPLYGVRTMRGDWRTVIQAPELKYVQMVRIELCKDTQTACFTALSPLSDIRTFCKQKYGVWGILVYKENNGTEKVQVELPICCSCHYEHVTKK